MTRPENVFVGGTLCAVIASPALLISMFYAPVSGVAALVATVLSMRHVAEENFCTVVSMNIGNDEDKCAVALTRASLDKIPPQLRIVTGHDDHVMLFLLCVGDVSTTTEILASVLTLAETESVVDTLEKTRGLVRKEFPVDDANRPKDSLETAGTSVELVRPTNVGSGSSESTSSAPRSGGNRGHN